jgi:hypothetical protein
MNKKQMFKILEQFKKYIGFADYKILVSKEYINMGNDYAEISIDIYEKELNIVLSNRFKTLSYDKQRNVLIHELVHGRILVYKKTCELITSFEEETLANDLTRGLESIK